MFTAFMGLRIRRGIKPELSQIWYQERTYANPSVEVVRSSREFDSDPSILNGLEHCASVPPAVVAVRYLFGEELSGVYWMRRMLGCTSVGQLLDGAKKLRESKALPKLPHKDFILRSPTGIYL